MDELFSFCAVLSCAILCCGYPVLCCAVAIRRQSRSKRSIVVLHQYCNTVLCFIFFFFFFFLLCSRSLVCLFGGAFSFGGAETQSVLLPHVAAIEQPQCEEHHDFNNEIRIMIRSVASAARRQAFQLNRANGKVQTRSFGGASGVKKSSHIEQWNNLREDTHKVSKPLSTLWTARTHIRCR